MESGINSTTDNFQTSNSHHSNLNSVFSANRLFHAAAILDFYYTPLLCFLGCVGNCLSVSVFCINANHRNLSSSYYLSALAISDTGFLITLFVLWLDGLGAGLLSSKFGCSFIMFSGQVTCFLSVWVTVAFTVERFFAVCSPLRRSSVCTVSKAKKVILSLTTFALIAFSYVLFISQVVEYPSIRNTEGFNRNSDDNGTLTQSPHDGVGISQHSFTEENLMPVESILTGAQLSNTTNKLKECQSGYLGTGFGESCNQQFGGVEGDYFPESEVMESDTFLQGIGNEVGNTYHSLQASDNEFRTTTMHIINSTLVNLNQAEKEVAGTELICSVPKKYITISIIANYLDSMITLIVPFCLITYFNMRIAVCVWRLKDERRMIVALPKMNTKRSTQRPSGLKDYFSKVIYQRKSQQSQSQHNQVDGIESQELSFVVQAQVGDEWGKPKVRSFGDSGEVTKPKRNLENQPSPTNEANEEHLFLQEVNSVENKSSSNPTLRHDVDVRNNGNVPFVLGCCDEQEPGGNAGCSFSSSHCLRKKVSEVEVSPSVQTSRSKSLKNLIPNSVNGNGIDVVSRRGKFRSGGSTPTHSSETRVTKMLLLVSTVFLVLNLPSHAIRAAAFFQAFLWADDNEARQRLHAAQQLSNILLFNSNFAVNFLLYCLSGRNFRKSLWNVLLGRCNKKSLHWRSARSNANNTMQKTVRFGPRHLPDANDELDCSANVELCDQPNACENSANKQHAKYALNDFETVELEITFA